MAVFLRPWLLQPRAFLGLALSQEIACLTHTAFKGTAAERHASSTRPYVSCPCIPAANSASSHFRMARRSHAANPDTLSCDAV